ncbi:pentapeptide repeat-containing protein [Amycolatopsis sp. NPDC098790]|uniref:pentapeptide repeat-containing protein n=1 Tax=Amycolatopsis sp. NPDC098790 TaxID=3363939 RepID=UPI0038242A17
MTSLITAATALGALVFTGLSLSATRDQVNVSQQSQITDRYTKAIEQIGAQGREHLQTRLGGIYALERLAYDSSRDQPTIIEVLSAFVRSAVPVANSAAAPCPPPPVGLDVQAALTVLGRRDKANDQGAQIDLQYTCLGGAQVFGDLSEANLMGADLTGTNLTGVDLIGTNLMGVNLTRASLAGANVIYADLTNANLSEALLITADFTNANLDGAHLTNANLDGAHLANATLTVPDLLDASHSHVSEGVAGMGATDLTGANLTGADLTNANLTGANLTDADLTSTDLTRANLAGSNLTRARHDATTRIDHTSRTNTVGAWW